MPGTVVRFVEPLVAELVDDPEDRAAAPLAAGEVRLRTLYSGISAGTELTAYRGSNPYLTKRWDADTRLFSRGAPPSPIPSTAGATRRSARSSRSASGRRRRARRCRLRHVGPSYRARGRRSMPPRACLPPASRRSSGSSPDRGDRAERRARRRHPPRRDRGGVRPGRARPDRGPAGPPQRRRRHRGRRIPRRLELAARLGAGRRSTHRGGCRGRDQGSDRRARRRRLHRDQRRVSPRSTRRCGPIAYNSRVVAAGFFQGDAARPPARRGVPPQPHPAHRARRSPACRRGSAIAGTSCGCGRPSSACAARGASRRSR